MNLFDKYQLFLKDKNNISLYDDLCKIARKFCNKKNVYDEELCYDIASDIITKILEGKRFENQISLITEIKYSVINYICKQSKVSYMDDYFVLDNGVNVESLEKKKAYRIYNDDEIRREAENMYLTEFCRKYNYEPSYLSKFAKKNGIKFAKWTKNKESKLKIIEKYMKNHTVKETMEYFEMTYSQVKHLISRKKFKYVKSEKYHEKKNINIDEVIEYAKEHHLSDCARRFNVSRSLMTSYRDKYNIQFAEYKY